MSDDDSDPEAQGVDALRLLKQGSIGIRGKARSAGVPSTSEPSSTPLVPLQPSQKRSRSLSQDLNVQTRPSGSQKVQPGNAAGMHRAPSGAIRVPPSTSHSQEGRQGDIKQHKSAPEHYASLSKELRSCKSAPDLRLPALAAIRGLQDGTLQVDRHTRLKIAAAARKVLEARELKRRSSQDKETLAQYSLQGPEPASPLALKSQALWDKPVQNTPADDILSPEQRLPGREESKAPAEKASDVPESLVTAAAIASGQTSSKANASPNSKANFHRPALGTVSQGGALLSTSHRPFTVTTGLPRFAPAETAVPSDDGQITPQLPITPPKAQSSRENTGQKLPSSMVLSMGDLFTPKSGGNEDKA